MMKLSSILSRQICAAAVNVDSASLKWLRSDGDAMMLFVTGKSVGCRPNDPADPITRRIECNKDLYTTVSGDGLICYVRKDVVDVVSNSIGKHVVGVVVYRETDMPDIESEIESICAVRLSFSSLKHDLPLCNALASGLLKKILLPVLLIYLAILLANFFIHSSLTERIGTLRAETALRTVAERQRTEITKSQERLFLEYDSVYDLDIAVLADAVASILPDDIRLISLGFNGADVVTEGEALSADTVLLFAQKLKSDNLFQTVNVVRLEKDMKEDVFKFEINMRL